MAALDPAEARRAPRHRDAEAGDDRLGCGEVDLILVVNGDRDVIERGVILGASRRERDLDGAVDLLGRWGRPMAGDMPGLAVRPLGLIPERPLGEGGSLTLPGPPGLLQLVLEPLHLGAEFLDQAGLSLVLIEELIVSEGRNVHNGFFHDRRPQTL